MTTLHFIPIFEDQKFVDACNEYAEIWEKNRSSILETFKEIAGLELHEDRIAVLVYEGVSFSGRDQNDVMKLRASYDNDTKKGTLIHELGHRLIFDLPTHSPEEEHELLNLFLYDVWEKLYGKDFAAKMVEIESKRSDMYKNAWKLALNLDFNQRQEQFQKKLTFLKD